MSTKHPILKNNSPNILLIVCDQLRAFEVGCYGNSVVRTPNIDRLANEGVRFETAICNSPLCTPARSCLLSGQYARTCCGSVGCVGEPDNARRHFGDATLPEVLQQNGYRTGLVGKWHLQPKPELLGFEEYVYPRVPHRHTHREYSDNNSDSFTVEEWTWDYDLHRAGQFLNKTDERPFFLYFNIEPPHMPLADAPDTYTKMYPRDEVQLRSNVWQNGELPFDEHWFKVYLWDYLYYREHQPHTEKLPSNFDLRDVTTFYYGLTTLVDDQVGKLMKVLSESGYGEDTVVVFTSDHGDCLGSHGYYNKGRLFEEAIRIPLVYHFPAEIKPQVQSEQITSLIDVAPTLLDLVNLRVPTEMQGTNLSPVLRGDQSTLGENVAFIECHQAGADDNPAGAIGIRTPTHLYGAAIEQGQYYGYLPDSRIVDDRLMFFDLQADPFQMHDMAQGNGQSQLASELRNRLTNWHRSTLGLAPISADNPYYEQQTK